MMKTDILDVPGATLHYEVRGGGPVLLLVCGGIYDAQGYADLADALADRYTVVTYDRRGNSRSPLTGPAAPQRVEEHGDDAYRLLVAVGVTAERPAYVFGNSSGGVIALELAARHPDLVRTVVAHEPPLVTLLPDADAWLAVMREVGEAFRAGGPMPAFGRLDAAFRADAERNGNPLPGHGGDGDEVGPATDPGTAARQQGNMASFVGYEVPGFAPYTPDFTALAATRVVAAVGDGAEGAPPWVRGARAVAERIGASPVVFPGDHGGFGGRTATAFAERLHETLDNSR